MSFCWRCGEIQFETWIALKLNQSTFSEVIFNKKNTFWCVWTGNASISKKYVCCPITVIHLFVFIIKLQIIYFYYLYFKIGLSAHYSYLTKMILKISNSQLMWQHQLHILFHSNSKQGYFWTNSPGLASNPPMILPRPFTFLSEFNIFKIIIV
jgi:hypothetical protein